MREPCIQPIELYLDDETLQRARRLAQARGQTLETLLSGLVAQLVAEPLPDPSPDVPPPSQTEPLPPPPRPPAPADVRKQVEVYTDGACSGNPGPGGYGAILMYGGHRRELSGGFLWTTNNRMELLAAIEALECLKTSCVVAIHSDSRYVVQSMEQRWVHRWRSLGWKAGRERRPVPNKDLWQRLLGLCEKHEVHFHWVKGHAGHPENEAADRLAVKASRQPDLPPDPGYETSPPALLP